MRLGEPPSCDKPFDWRLHDAAGEDDLKCVQVLISEGLPINALDGNGFTPLHYAVKENHIAVVKYLVSLGADVNAQANGDDWQDDTPLGSVAGTCSFEMAELLVKLRADPTLSGWMGNSALNRAKERTDPEGRSVYNLLRNAKQIFWKHRKIRNEERDVDSKTT